MKKTTLRASRLFLYSMILFVAAGGLGTIMTDEVFAQVRPAITKNIDEPGRIPYQQYVQGMPGSGCGTNFCTFLLPAVPAGKRLVITNFYGTVNLQPNAKVDSLRLIAYDTTNPSSWVEKNSFEVPHNPAAYYSVALTYQLDRYAFNAPVQMYVDAGQTPVIDFWTGPGSLNEWGWQSKFTVIGYLVDLNL